MVIPSSEVYLCKGIRDYLEKEINDIMVFGPNKYQSQIEGSKHYSKKLMKELNIPTSDFIYLDNYYSAKNFYSNVLPHQ